MLQLLYVIFLWEQGCICLYSDTCSPAMSPLLNIKVESTLSTTFALQINVPVSITQLFSIYCTWHWLWLQCCGSKVVEGNELLCWWAFNKSLWVMILIIALQQNNEKFTSFTLFKYNMKPIFSSFYGERTEVCSFVFMVHLRWVSASSYSLRVY